MKDSRNGNQRPDAGVAIIYVAVFLLSSLWLVSLAIDMGKLMATKTELQAAADAAALAGASSINPLTGTVVQDSARARATYTASRNRAFEEKQRAVIIDPLTDINFPTPTRVRVRVHREEATGNAVVTTFAQTLGVDHLNVTADATAEAQQLTDICEGLAPFAPIEPPNGTPYSTDCNTSYALKVGSGQQQQGNFQLLDYPSCNEGPCAGVGGGANAVRCYTINGYSCCVGIGSEFISTEPGNKVGPLKQALTTRWDEDTDKTSHCYENYTGNGKRVFICPMIESFDVNGKKLVRIKGFAAFFLQQKPTGGGQGSVATGQFIKYVAPGQAGSEPPVSTGIYGVHLVE